MTWLTGAITALANLANTLATLFFDPKVKSDRRKESAKDNWDEFQKRQKKIEKDIRPPSNRCTK